MIDALPPFRIWDKQSRRLNLKETVEVAGKLHELARKTISLVPFVLLINKHDFVDEWVVECPMVSDLSAQACLVSMVSAKTGEGVETAFSELSEAMLKS